MATSEGRLVLVNAQTEKLFGYRRDELIGHPVERLLTETLNDIHPRHRKGYLKNARVRSMGAGGELRVRRKDGRELYVEINLSPIETETGLFVAGSIREVNNRERREQPLSQSEGRLRLMADALPVLISYVDRDQRYRFNNAAYEKWFGVSLEAIKGRNVREIVGDKAYAAIKEHIELALSGWDVSYQSEIPLRDGSRRWVQANYVPHRDDNGEVLGFYALVNDITESKHTERELAERLRFEELFAELSGLFVNAPAGKIDSLIEQGLKLIVEFLQVDRATLFQHSADQGLFDATHSYVAKDIKPLASGFAASELPWVAAKLLQGQVLALARIEDLPGEAVAERRFHETEGTKSQLAIPLLVGGAVQGALSFETLTAHRTWPEPLVQRLRLVAEILANALLRKRTEQALRESEELLRTTFEEAPVGIASLTLVGKFIDANKRLCEILGYPREELLGKNFQDIAHSNDIQGLFKVLSQSAVKQLSVQALERRLLTRDGATLWAKVMFSPLRGESGGAHGIIAVIEDITERRRAQEELNNRLQFETLISDLSATFVNAPPDEIDRRIEHGLGRLAEFIGADRGSFVQFNPKQTALRVTHLWMATGIEPDDFLRQVIVNEHFPWITGKARRRETILITKLDDFPAAVVNEKAYAQQAGIKSFFMVPIAIGGSVVGMVAFDSMRRERRWSDELVQRVRLAGEVFANALIRMRNQKAIDRLNRFERLISDISSTFVNLPADEVDRNIEDGLRRLGECLDTDLGTVLLLDADTKQYRVTHEWVGPHVEQDSGFLGVAIDDQWPWLRSELIKHEPLTISRLDDFPAAAALERATCERIGIKSVVWVPFNVADTVRGYVALNTVREALSWTEYFIQRLQLVGEIFANALVRMRAQDALAERMRFEHLLSSVSARFVNLLPEKVDVEIKEGLRELGELMEVDRCFLDQFSQDQTSFRLTHLWTADGIEQEEGIFDMVLNEQLPWYTAKILGGEPLIINTAEDLPEEAKNEKEYLRGAGVQSSTIVPLSVAGRVIGNIGLDAIRGERTWSADVVQRLRLIGEVFANALQRQRLDRTLRASEEGFRTMFESAPTAVAAVDQSGKFIRVNHNLCRMLGYTEQELLRLTFRDVTHPDDLEDSEESWNKLQDGKAGQASLEKRYIRKDGASVWGNVMISAMRDQSDRISHVVAVIVDITERKKADMALKVSRVALQRSELELRELAGKLLNAQEEERRRLARELHDDLTQRLAVLAIEAGKLEGRLQESGSRDHETLLHIKEQLVQISADVHVLSRQLHPGILDDLGLVDALRSECNAFSKREAIAVKYKAGKIEQKLPREAALCVYRIVQEGLRNIAKHSQAKKAYVTLTEADQGIQLKVKDIGAGFDAQKAQGKAGLGLQSMEERVRLAQGRFSISSRPGKGTQIDVWVPMTEVQHDE